MNIVMKDEDTFLVTEQYELAAAIHLDFRHQVELLVLHTKDLQKRRRIRELVLSHAIQYCVERTAPAFGGILMATRQSREPRSKAESYGLMDFRMVMDTVKTLADDNLNASLAQYVKTVEAKYGTSRRTLLAAVSRVIQKFGVPLKFIMLPGRFPEEMSVHFLSEKKEFRFWNWLQKEEVPKHQDHPQYRRKKVVVAINGSTEAVVSHRYLDAGIRSLIYPGASGETFGVFRKKRTEEYVEAPSFSMIVDRRKFVSKGSFQFVVDLLTATLGLQPGYVEVI